MTIEEKFKKLTNEEDEAIVEIMLEKAEDYILNYTNRSALPERLEGAKLDIAIAMYNCSGAEGYASHTEGGVSVTFSNEKISNNTINALNFYRLGRVGGNVFEKKIT